MPTLTIEHQVSLSYEDHCFADPWTEPETIVLIHGNGDSAESWYAWVPELSGRFRVIRPDLRGFGKSSVPPPGYAWSPAAHAADVRAMLDALGIKRAHIVGAKYGATVAAQFGADFPDRVITLGLIGPLIKGANTGSKMDANTLGSVLDHGGHAGFAVNTQSLRLGTDAPAAQIAWWNEAMLEGDQRVAEEILRMASQVDLTPSLPRIVAPTLVLTADKSATQRLEYVLQWQRQLRDSELCVLPCDGYHIAAARAHDCAQQIQDFIARRAARKA